MYGSREEDLDLKERRDPKLFVKVPVFEFDDPHFSPMFSVYNIGYYGWSACRVPNTRYAIPLNSLPSVEDLIFSSRSMRGFSHGSSGPFVALRSSVYAFAALYVNSPGKLPLVGISPLNCPLIVRADRKSIEGLLR